MRCTPAENGTGPKGETCRTCEHCTISQHAKRYYKCGLMKHLWTRGSATDIRVRWPACSEWVPVNGVAYLNRLWRKLYSDGGMLDFGPAELNSRLQLLGDYLTEEGDYGGADFIAYVLDHKPYRNPIAAAQFYNIDLPF